MRRQSAMTARLIAVVLCLSAVGDATTAAAGMHATAPARSVAPGGTWGTALEVPGTGALNQGGQAEILSVSCGAPGNCSAGGHYKDGSAYHQAFVVSETNGTWGTAQKVPGTAALNTAGDAVVGSVSCASAGDCSAGGSYADSSGQQAFVVSEANGTWGTAQEVPGTAALNTGGGAYLVSVSCASAGNCSAAGGYTDSSGQGRPFVVSETKGTWGTAREVPGIVALNPGVAAGLVSVSCASAGNCSAVGGYRDGFGYGRVFAVGEVNGTWGSAKEIPGTAALDQGGQAGIAAVSCASAGNCSAGGSYTDSSGQDHPFVVSERKGAWGTAQELSGTVALDQGGSGITSVSCAWPRNCSAGGYYQDSGGNQQALEAAQVQGIWVAADQVPGTAALNQGESAEIASVSCRRAGYCSAGGYYYASNNSGDVQAFVVTEVDWIWGGAQEVPGLAALNQGGPAEINSVSCAAPGHCSAGGYYHDSSGNQQVFVVNQT